LEKADLPYSRDKPWDKFFRSSASQQEEARRHLYQAIIDQSRSLEENAIDCDRIKGVVSDLVSDLSREHAHIEGDSMVSRGSQSATWRDEPPEVGLWEASTEVDTTVVEW